MDVQQMVGQLLESVAKDPQCLEQFGVDTAEVIKNATGLDLSDEEMGHVIKAVEPPIEGKELNMESVMALAGVFLADHPEDLLGRLGGLFGGK